MNSGTEMGKNSEGKVTGVLVKCSECGRSVLVERGLFGVDHTVGTVVTCWSCLDDNSRRKAIEKYKLNPEARITV